MVIPHFASESKTNSILNEFDLFAIPSAQFIVICSAGALTKRTDSLRMLTKLFNVFVGSLACGGG